MRDSRHGPSRSLCRCGRAPVAVRSREPPRGSEQLTDTEQQTPRATEGRGKVSGSRFDRESSRCLPARNSSCWLAHTCLDRQIFLSTRQVSQVPLEEQILLRIPPVLLGPPKCRVMK